MYIGKNVNTLNTTRICGGNHFQNAVAISDVVFADKSPDSIIITNGEIIHDAIISTSVIHFPYNAPILFSHTDYIDINTLNQIYKLNPQGVNGIQIFLIGGISEAIGQYLISLGFTVKILSGANIYETAANVARFLDNLDNIIILSFQNYQNGLSACAWAAHMGVPILFTEKNQLPYETINVIVNSNHANVFLFGNTDDISEQVEKELTGLNINYLERITGNDPYDVSVNFSKYKSPDGKFGWGKTDRNGHAFTFTAIENPYNSVSGALFAHLGKHSPILIIDKNRLPSVTRNYIESVKPISQAEPQPPFMHGWVIGCEYDISFKTQIEIEKALSIDTAHMHGMS